MKCCDLDQRRALHVLNGLPKVGPVSLRRLLDHFENDAVRILDSEVGQLMQVEGIGRSIASVISAWAEHFDLEREEEVLKKHGGMFVCLEDDDYPALLREIYDSPIGLYFLGTYRIDRPCVAIVGTRRASLYGQGVATRLGQDLARIGFCVVSGMARGIDSAAHRGALSENGKTVAVLGCGPDIVYPPENYELYRDLIDQGAIISEFPLGRRADKQTFPMRNRIVSGLSCATVVVESGKKGGSMITAKFAAEHGRHLFAVPGRIDQTASQGCHQLIRDGAVLFRSIDDLLEELQYQGQLEMGFDEPGKVALEFASWELPDDLGEEAKQVAALFKDGSILSCDDVASMTQLAVPQVNASLVMLELRRVLVKQVDGRYGRRG